VRRAYRLPESYNLYISGEHRPAACRRSLPGIRTRATRALATREWSRALGPGTRRDRRVRPRDRARRRRFESLLRRLPSEFLGWAGDFVAVAKMVTLGEAKAMAFLGFAVSQTVARALSPDDSLSRTASTCAAGVARLVVRRLQSVYNRCLRGQGKLDYDSLVIPEPARGGS
jgi:hypothetical protein